MRYDTKRIVRLSLIALFMLLLLGFIFTKTRDSIFGARLTALTITDGQVVTNSYLEIKGQMKNAASITINGAPVLPNQEGAFTDQVILQPGYNPITIRTEDKFGKKMEKTYTLIYNEQANETLE